MQTPPGERECGRFIVETWTERRWPLVVPPAARALFAVLGFREAVSCVIKGGVFARYMDVADIEAEHITLVLENASSRAEIQMLRYLHPKALPDEHIHQQLAYLEGPQWY